MKIRTVPHLFAFLATYAAAGAAPPPTQAWRHTFSGSNQIGGIDVDPSGYCYVHAGYYDGTNQSSTLYKIGPSGNVAFSTPLLSHGPLCNLAPPAVGPVISGKASVYLVASDTSANRALYVVMANAATGSVTGSNLLKYGPELGQGLTAGGHLMVATKGPNLGGAYLYDYNGPAVTTGAIPVSTVTLHTLNATAAVYDPASSCWFLSGGDPSDPNQNNAVWGSYAASTGSFNFGGTAVGANTGQTSRTICHCVISLLPGNKFALATTQQLVDYAASTTTTAYSLRVADRATNAQSWIYPATGYDAAGTSLGQVIARDTTSPIYGVGVADTAPAGRPTQNFRVFDWSGHLLGATYQSPVGTVFPTTDGFYDLFDWSSGSASFLEHYSASAAKFDWGKSYGLNSLGGTPAGYFKEFDNPGQNSFYVVANDSSGNPILDRFVLGTALSSLSIPTTFTRGGTLKVTINMNQAVQSGETRTVSLYSTSANVMMPNGQRSQAFSIPTGQQSVVVTLTTTDPGSSYGVVIKANQYGVYRFASSTSN